MRVHCWILLVAALLLASCTMRVDTDEHSGNTAQPLTPERQAAVENAVRRFAASVAHDVTQEGPSAWRKEFSDSPSFFMASEGKLVFPNRQAAEQAIDELARTLKRIELSWGDDLRVDALTENLAQVACSWHEIRVDTEGHRVEESGFFTGLAEKQKGQWQFRNAHWSIVVPPAKVP
jgi:hypothetical protein